jgi:thiamine-phosphate pyrophosphorylase
MPRRQPPLLKKPQSMCRHGRKLPKIWLMTDARFGDGLLPAIQALPMGSGVIFRHYHLPAADRYRLLQAVRKHCRRRGHVLLLAAPPLSARHWDIDGVHNQAPQKPTHLQSASVHNIAELRAAVGASADVLFVSPVRATATHPGAPVLGIMGLKQLASLHHPTGAIIALGGMNRRAAAPHKASIIYGWGGIDAFRTAMF